MTITIVTLCICLLLILIAYLKVNSFFAFLIVSILTAFFLGIPIENISKTIQKGFGDMLGSISIIIICGTCLGKIAAESGAIEIIANKLIKITGTKYIKIGLMLAGLLIGIPLFYSIGFVIMIPFVFTLSKKYNLSAIPLAIPMLSALSVAHGFLPPHPSPIALSIQLNANITKILIYGLIISIPCVLIAGLFYSKFLNKIVSNPTFFNKKLENNNPLPNFTISLLTTLSPVFLLLLFSILKNIINNSSLLKLINFLSEPSIIMIISLTLATYSLGIKLKYNIEKIMNIYVECIKDISIILLIMGGAGMLKEVFMVSNFDKYLASISSNLTLHPFLLSWLIAAIIRLLIGSATIAGIMSATIILPIISNNPNIDTNLIVLAIGSGSLVGSHINDPAFWMFKEYFNISIKNTLKSWTVMETIVSIVGLISVFILNFFLH